LRNNKTGALELYDIANNVLTSAKLIESMIALSLAPQFKDRAIREAH
jgi:hypothetical protein